MSKAGKMLTIIFLFTFFFAANSMTVTYASDECKAGCQIAYKACKKGCDGDLDCELNCSDAKDECIAGCGN